MKCGMGHQYFGCIRPKGHHSPVSVCFAIIKGSGVYLYQDGKTWLNDRSEWPKDIILDDDDQSK